MPPMSYFLGLDLGQKRDYSALVVVERVDRGVAFQARREFDRVLVRYAERMPLGTSYTTVVERVREIVRSGPMRGDCALVVDATGVGAPVVDMLREANLGCDLTAVTITGGERAGAGSVPRRDLIAGVQVLLEKGQLKIGRLREAERLAREMAEMKVSGGGSEHDDLVMALALACWRAKERVNGEGTQRLF
jgi:hypothetical protein